MFQTFDNKRIIVVGASRGLGRGIALALSRTGAKVLAVARNVEALRTLREESEGHIDIRPGDATNPSFSAQVMAQENPHALFLVAGASPVMRPITEYQWESFSDNWNTDVKATFHWLQDAVNKPMQDGSRIVVFSSGAALHGSPLSGGYAAAKQAQRLLCGYMTKEVERLGRPIRIQAILPQLNPNTELGRSGVQGYARLTGETPEEYVKKRFGEHPLSPEKAGEEMVRLLSEEELLQASKFVLPGAGLKVLP